MYPMQNGVIALLLLVAVAVVFWRLAARGPTRMSRALYTIAAVLLCVVLLGLVLSEFSRSGPG
ncbi:MAG: hypothetical protein QOC93_2829 [Actinomycetota bacterium]|jgi:hypothetical protein|nr:hypothetical protein [Actinomycetota bacterium]